MAHFVLTKDRCCGTIDNLGAAVKRANGHPKTSTTKLLYPFPSYPPLHGPGNFHPQNPLLFWNLELRLPPFWARISEGVATQKKMISSKKSGSAQEEGLKVTDWAQNADFRGNL